jgi:hypothetical protein
MEEHSSMAAASSAELGSPGPSRTATVQPAVGRIGAPAQRADAGMPVQMPGAAGSSAAPRPQPMTLSEVAALLSEFRVLLRHVVRCGVPDANGPLLGDQPGSVGQAGHLTPFPPGVHVELLTREPEEIACDETLLQQLYSSVRVMTGLAAPATVSSIYLTSAFLHDEISSLVSAEARSAAQRLRRWAVVTGLLGVMLFAVALMLLVHVDRGRREIQQLEHVRNEYQLVVSAIDQTHDPNLLADCMKGATEPEASGQPRGINHPPLCERLRAAVERMQVVHAGLAAWNIVSYRLAYLMPIRWLGSGDPVPADLSQEQWQSSELRASAVMAGFTGFVLPMLLALLGAFTYVYRNLDRRVRTATLEPGDGLHGTLRMLLGMILGGLLGVLWTNGQPIQLEGVTLSLTALAFFVGYSVEVVFQVLDSIVTKVAGAIRKYPLSAGLRH